MEIEVWLLAFNELFNRIDARIDSAWLFTNVGIDVSKVPQITYFHPFSNLENIYTSIERTYSKHWREIKEIIFKLQNRDFEQLYYSVKCSSFNLFYNAVFNRYLCKTCNY